MTNKYALVVFKNADTGEVKEIPFSLREVKNLYEQTADKGRLVGYGNWLVEKVVSHMNPREQRVNVCE